ncbi:DUF72 domain-containing protein [Aquibium oceanicum]|uniref:DUF72 domain-containing protein n=1 Tax=Aquibium oceanicum TaxID=1670800 RepID=UPI0009FB7017|nr:DUF72 domain-containing protein [Aquibium oceanicum]
MDARHATGTKTKASKAPRSRGKATGSRGRKTADLRIGTSGWHYADWWGPFYPGDVKKKDALQYYTGQFAATELNAPFYRTPTPEAVEKWRESTPDNFRFAWKASRFITHFRRLKIDEDSFDLLRSRLELLGDKLGPVLFQLHPQMKVDRERLAGFLDRLWKEWRYSLEFRHESWYEPAILDLLSEFDAALCISDHASAPAPCEVTASWVYVRNHGPGGRYQGSYSDAALKSWAKSIARWRGEGRDVWCFFDNDVKSAAPQDAKRLIGMLEKS